MTSLYIWQNLIEKLIQITIKDFDEAICQVFIPIVDHGSLASASRFMHTILSAYGFPRHTRRYLVSPDSKNFWSFLYGYLDSHSKRSSFECSDIAGNSDVDEINEF